MNIGYYLSRLKNASLPEIWYRTREAALALRLKGAAKKGGGLVAVPAVDWPALDALRLPAVQAALTAEEITNLLHGSRWCLHEEESALQEFEQGERRMFYASIPRGGAGPDIRAVWEPARLQNLAALLFQVANGDGDRKREAAAMVQATLLAWLENNPFLFGPHYISVMECGLRIPVFFYALKILDTLEAGDKNRIAEAIFRHAWLTENRLSLFSSLGNHTIAECIGLVFAGAVFRGSGDGARWLEKGVALLRQELNHQILPDGGPAEQSLDYHRFVLDLYWLVVDFLQKNQLADCADFHDRLLTGEEFLAAFQYGPGLWPAIGDSDDGWAVAPGIAPQRPERIFEKRPYLTFPHSGYTIIRTENDALLTFDHGPLGMPPLFNHGHADALSVTLAHKGEPLLVDPGTYRYNGAPEWRRYFKGTRAHNTVTVDGLDQAVQDTGFVWSRPFPIRVTVNQVGRQGRDVAALHDGYRRLKKPVSHERTIRQFDGGNFFIQDAFSGSGPHRFELNFHFHPEAAVERDGSWWKITKGAGTVYLFPVLGEFQLACGELHPPAGWYSPAYGVKVAGRVLRMERTGLPEEVSFATAVCTTGMVETKRLEDLLCII